MSMGYIDNSMRVVIWYEMLLWVDPFIIFIERKQFSHVIFERAIEPLDDW